MTSARIDLIHELVSAAALAAPSARRSSPPTAPPSTFAEFDRQVGAVAAWVDAQTRRGDRVAVIADNGASYARLYYAVPRCGRILSLINQRLSPREQFTQLTSAEPTILLGDARHLDPLSDVVPQIPSMEQVAGIRRPAMATCGT